MLKDLQRVLAEVQGSPNPALDSLLERLASKEFWCYEKNGKKDCCFNHIIGLPEKQGQPKPIFDYEIQLLSELLRTNGSIKDKHLFIKKATGLGITEFCLRFIVWLATKDDEHRGTQVVIVTGPSIELAIGLIKRIKSLFERHENLL